MKTYFLFHDVWYQYIKADLAASQFPFDGYVVVRRTRPWWGKYLWRRARRLGVLKVLDEALLRLYWIVVRSHSDRRMLKSLMRQAQESIPADFKRPPVYHLDNINSDEAVALLKRLAPDACVLMINVILKEKIFSIPPLGMLVFHPGVTPEYRGPHSAFWATLNNEFWGIGWSLLRVDKGVDTGPVLAQGSCKGARPLEESHVFMQHKSHVEAIPDVVATLRQLAAGEAPRVNVANRRSTNYTHPGVTDYLRLRRALKWLRRGDAPPGAPKPEGVL
jgi:folate-dependent phosphoribosylglycinamide formyltransferase PurN